MKLVTPNEPEVVRAFKNWYEQLNDIQRNELNSYLRSTYSTSNPPVRPHFGGRKYGMLASSSEKQDILIECPSCSKTIKIQL